MLWVGAPVKWLNETLPTSTITDVFSENCEKHCHFQLKKKHPFPQKFPNPIYTEMIYAITAVMTIISQLILV